MSTTPQEFLQTHAPDGVLSPEHADQLLALYEGDTGGQVTATPESGAPNADAADTTTKTAEQGNPEPPPSAVGALAAEVDPANAVILAKDGKHTIPYEKLIEARDGEKHWKAQHEAATLELQALKAQSQARVDAGQAPTVADNQVAAAEAAITAGVNPALFGDFSEEAMAKGIDQLLDQRAKGIEQQLDQRVAARVEALMSQALAPLQAKEAKSSIASHYDAIAEAHPDAGSLVESKELADWIESQPSFARAGYAQALAGGTTEQVIELFTEFKKATGATQATAGAAQVDPKAAAQAAIAKAQPQVPVSLSAFPGAAPGPANAFETLASLSPAALLEALEGMTESQREAYLSR